MDSKFPDRMNDLGEITEQILEQRWTTLLEVAEATDTQKQARLVLIACGAGLHRNGDEWFWEPFRVHEKLIPVDDGPELFTRLAECAVRYLIDEKRYLLPAMFVRLAEMSGLSPFHQDMVDSAVDLLVDRPSKPPVFSAPGPFWTTASKQALEADPGNPNVLQQQLIGMVSTAQKAMTAVAKQTAAMTTWAVEAQNRFDREQRLIHWLLNGVRGDGTSWRELDPATVAVDGAAELAALVIEAPQPRHEATMSQVLAVAEKPNDVVSGPVADLRAEFVLPTDPAMADLVPLTVAIAAGKAIPEISPDQLAIRFLWETTTILRWSE